MHHNGTLLMRHVVLVIVASTLIALPVRATATDRERLYEELRSQTLGPLQLVSDFRLDASAAEAIHDDLVALSRQLHFDLGVPEYSVPTRIYLFESFDGFRNYLLREVPGLHLSSYDVQREGLFLLRNGRPYLFVFGSCGPSRMLRHEFVHAVLNTSHPRLPIWLDEGLAEYYAEDDPLTANQAHRDYLARRRRWGWRPSLARLQRRTYMQQFNGADYAESWSWMHFLQNGPAEVRGVLPAYLADLRAGRPEPNLPDRVSDCVTDPRDAWYEHFREFE
jgi:hypothetical protein